MGAKPRDPNKKTPEEMIGDLQRRARDLEARILAQEKAYHAERATAAHHRDQGRVVLARQAISRSIATRRNMEMMQNSAHTCWSLAVHIDSLGLLAGTYDVLNQSSVMIEGMLKSAQLDPDKVSALTEKLQESTQVSNEIQEALSRPLDVSAVASGETDYDFLDSELAMIDLDEEMKAVATIPTPTVEPAVVGKPTTKQAAKPVAKAVAKGQRATPRGSVMPPVPVDAAARTAQAQLARSPPAPTTTPSAAAAAAAVVTSETNTSSGSGRMVVMLSETQ